MRRILSSALVLTLALALATPPTAYAGKPAEGGTTARTGINGFVVDGVINTPLGGVFVTAYQYDSRRAQWNVKATSTTNADGGYSLALSSGTYRIGYAANGYVAEFHGDAVAIASASDLVVPKTGFVTASPGLQPGTGSVDDPYRVYDLVTLDRVRNDLDAHYVQVRDIEASPTGAVGSPWNAAGLGWVPIGGQYAPFTGTFNGGGWTIRDLTCARPMGGLFGFIKGTDWPHFTGINLRNVSITSGSGYAGSIAASAESLYIEDCSVEGTVTSVLSSAGGVVGWSWGTVFIMRCDVNAAVQGSNAGGVFGWAYWARVFTTSVGGSIEGTRCGGLIGDAVKCAAFDSLVTASVGGPDSAVSGGLVGYANTSWSQSSSYVAGPIAGNEAAGGMVGTALCPEGIFSSNCFYDTEVSGLSTSVVGEPRGTADMQDPATFAGWDFAYTWIPPLPGVSYPTLR